jgi:hypothetical protein
LIIRQYWNKLVQKKFIRHQCTSKNGSDLSHLPHHPGTRIAAVHPKSAMNNKPRNLALLGAAVSLSCALAIGTWIRKL